MEHEIIAKPMMYLKSVCMYMYMHTLITTFCHFCKKCKVIGEVKDKVWNSPDEIPEDITVLIENATNIAWEMLTLIPPPVFCSPQKFNEDYQQVVGNTKGIGTYYRLSYCRPVMLYSAHGSVAVKGIARREASKERTENVNSDTESEG